MRSRNLVRAEPLLGDMLLQEPPKEGTGTAPKRTTRPLKRGETMQKRRQKRRMERSIRAQVVNVEHLTAIEGKAIVAFDLELSGTFPDDIIEIGAIRLQEGADSVSVFHELVHPRTFINRTVRKMTGLDKDDFKGKDRLPDILPAFLQFVGEDAVVLGHAVGDNDILSINLALARIAKKTGQRRKFCPPYVDTVRLAKSILSKDTTKFNLEALLLHFGWRAKQKHRALDDALGAYLLFECLLKDIPHGIPSFPSLFDTPSGTEIVLERFERNEES
ncbi:MAG: PolC-type DNA polymerase III [Mitsuokella sp.]